MLKVEFQQQTPLFLAQEKQFQFYLPNWILMSSTFFCMQEQKAKSAKKPVSKFCKKPPLSTITIVHRYLLMKILIGKSHKYAISNRSNWGRKSTKWLVKTTLLTFFTGEFPEKFLWEELLVQSLASLSTKSQAGISQTTFFF